MKFVYSDAHRGHDPRHFLVRGVFRRSADQPERADRLLKAIEGRHQRIAPEAFGAAERAAVHSPDYLRFLEEGHAEWIAVPGASDEIIPNIHPSRRHFADASYPASIVGRAGWHQADTACPIGPSTWAAAAASADVAATAAALVRDGAERAVYALCRPSGHHAYADMAGGFCYLNNSAIAAAKLRERYQRVAVLDVDLHHGNGTQGIFYERADVLTVSLHVDPHSFYPFFVGHAHERGAGAGEGRNLNLPLPVGTGDEDFLKALDIGLATIRAFAPGALVLALGLDASEHDPFGGLKVTTPGFHRIGAAVARLGLPTAIIQEGGYLCDQLGGNLAATLAGFESAA